MTLTTMPDKPASVSTITSDPATIPIEAIQGSGNLSPLVGQTVTARGVVTAISNGSTKGFYIQDPAGDGDAATSDAVFVYTGKAPSGIAIGDLVDVSGTVQEFTPRGTAPGTLSTTEISAVTSTAVVSSGNALPAATVIGVDGAQPPNADLSAGVAFYESLEGMLVTVEDPLVVGPTNRFGEIETVASGGSNATGLNARGDLLISGGEPSFGNTDTAGGDFNPERIQIDPGLGIANPDVSVGARLGFVTGIVGYDFGNYQVMAKTDPVIAEPSPLTKDAATLKGDAGLCSSPATTPRTSTPATARPGSPPSPTRSSPSSTPRTSSPCRRCRTTPARRTTASRRPQPRCRCWPTPSTPPAGRNTPSSTTRSSATAPTAASPAATSAPPSFTAPTGSGLPKARSPRSRPTAALSPRRTPPSRPTLATRSMPPARRCPRPSRSMART